MRLIPLVLPAVLLLTGCGAEDEGADRAGAEAVASKVEAAYQDGDGRAVFEAFCADHRKGIEDGEGVEAFAAGVKSFSESTSMTIRLDSSESDGELGAETVHTPAGPVAEGAPSPSEEPAGRVTFRRENDRWCLQPPG